MMTPGQHTLTGVFGFHPRFPSRHLGRERDVIVYLPPGYEAESRRRYPALYLQDGQNLFDAATSFAGVEWGVDETAGKLVRARQIEPLVVVGIYNTGDHRADEYTPTRNSAGQGGLAHSYARFLIEELKPFIDSHYRTRPDAPNTGLGGSSLGGLVSLVIGLDRSDVFGKLALHSPSVWWDGRVALEQVRTKLNLRIWLDIGTQEGRGTLADTRALRDALVSRGWRLRRDLRYFEARGGRHNEAAWARRVGPMLRWLFPARR
jgi:predicted alpha/beta superfamily hydrolase